MDSNALTVLPDLSVMVALRVLSVYSNMIREVGPLPPQLTYLRIDSNEISVLPTLPATLRQIIAHFNRIEWLPAPLPAGLVSLEMRSNSLVWLPPLPGTLATLKVGYNSLSALPAPLPSTLAYISAYGNRLMALPFPLPRVMDTIYVNFNNISNLSGIELLPRLTNFECGHNNLESLPNLGGLSELVKVDLSHNRLSDMPMFDSARGLERLLLNDNRITHPLQEALTAMGPRHPRLRILSLTNNPLGGSLSLAALIEADIDNVRPILPRMAKLEALRIANVSLAGEMYFSLLDTLWTGLSLLDISENPLLESFPLRHSGPPLRVLARGCPGLAPFIAGGLVPGGNTPEGGAFTNLTTFSTLPRAGRISNARHSECDEGVMAGTLIRFPVYLDADQLGFSSRFCSCMAGFYGRPDQQCLPCKAVSDSLPDTLSKVTCAAGRLTASGAWIFSSEPGGWGLSGVSCPRGGQSSPCEEASSEEAFRCAEGYGGRVCSRCLPGWFRLGRSCLKCSTGRWVVHPLLTTLSFVALLWSRRETAVIAVMHGQFLTLITRAQSTPPPDAVQQPLSWLLALSAFSLEGVECAGGDRIDQFNGPLLAACLLPFFCVVPAAIAALVPGPGEEGRWARFLSGWPVAFFAGLFVAAKSVFGVLACTDEFGPRGQMFVSDFLWLPCPVRTGPYRISYRLAFSCLTLFGLVTIILLGVVVARPERFHATAERLRDPFVHEWWWWERVRVGRRWALAIIHGLSPYGSPVITIGYVSVLTVSVLLQVSFRPFRDRKTGLVELASLVILYATFIFWKLISGGDDPYKYAWAMWLIIVTSIAFVIGILVWEIGSAVRAALAKMKK